MRPGAGGGDNARARAVVAAAAFAAAGLVCVGLRLIEVPDWSADRFFVAGERLMATHDAYAWLAGAKATSRYVLGPLAQLAAFLHGLTGLSLGTLGFWLPVAFAPLAALPACVMAWRQGRPEAAAVAGALAGGSLGFLVRSRLGFLDTDVLTLFFAGAAAAGLCLWLAPFCRPGWLPGRSGEEDRAAGEFPGWASLGLALLLGLFLRLYTVHYYSSGRPIVWALFLTAAAAGMVLARPGRRGTALLGLALALGVWLFGPPGLVAGLAAAALVRFRPELATDARALGAGAALLAGMLLYQGGSDMAFYGRLVGEYLRLTPAEEAGGAAAGALGLPSVMASVREATTIDFMDVVRLTAGHWAVFAAALAGFGLAAWRRPLLAVWLPLLGLGLASFKFGVRFTMYAGPVLGLGLGLGLAELAVLLRARWAVRLAVQVAALAVLVWVLALPIRDLGVMPVLSKPFAETLAGLRDKLPQDAVLWQWWDYGYAAQYYAERDSFGDGGRHDGQFLYPLALAHTTSSPLQAAQVMKLVAATLAEQRQEWKDRGQQPYPPAKLAFYPEKPMARLEAMGPEKAAQYVRSLAVEPREWPTHLPEQYLALAWDNLMLGGWITRYGAWDLVSGQRAGGKITPLRGEVSVDPRQGTLRTPQGQAPLSDLLVVDEQGRTHHMFWARLGGVYAVLNRITREVFVMDRMVYESMMVRMLLGDPKDFEPHFELVADNAPWCRVYRVR